ncbi:MAG: regulatory protein RecX [Geobacteraceae bacterium]|nr:regulatory protein RecX [Geobacteraceae bacterium]
MISRSSEPSSPERAYLYALRLLNARDYTVARLREKLRGRDLDEADLEDALVRVVSEGWVDDRRFAERFAESAVAAGRYYGPRLRQEMRRRGLPPELVSEVLGRVLGEHDEIEEVNTVVERRFSGFSFSTASDREKRRTVGFLQRRGFSLSAIMSALRATGR